jgi:hypothetical protein
LPNPTTWIWQYRGRSGRESTDRTQPSGGTSHDGKLKDEPIDAIGTLGQ